jgi:hypothetical protein
MNNDVNGTPADISVNFLTARAFIAVCAAVQQQ